jgi:hypothetical protein
MKRSETMKSEIAAAIRYAADQLGKNDAATGMGALEMVAKELLDGSQRIASALERIADNSVFPAQTSPEMATQQSDAVAHYLDCAVAEIDARFGQGYAKAHPELVGAFVRTAAFAALQIQFQPSTDGPDVNKILRGILKRQ